MKGPVASNKSRSCRRVIACVVCLLLLPLATAPCAGAHGWQPVRWESRDGRGPPGLSDSSDCRAQARRQAELRYPHSAPAAPLRPGVRMATGVPNDADRFPAETAFYADCMRRKGFELVTTQEAHRGYRS
jgi:hypothetical protein